MPRIQDANNRAFTMSITVKQLEHFWNKMDTVNFFLSEQLSALLIFYCDFFYKHIEATRPLKPIVELDDFTTVPIFRMPTRNPGTKLEPNKDKTYAPEKFRVSHKITLKILVTLLLGSQIWFEAAMARRGTIKIDPNELILSNHSCTAWNSVAPV